MHKEKHVAVIIDCFCDWKDRIATITFENKPSVFPEFLKEVNKYTKKSKVPVFGLEDTAGYGRSLAVYLVENGQKVKEVNAAHAKTERDKNPITQKFDEWDAFSMAQALRNKLNELPDANPQVFYWTIAQIVGRRRALVKATTALKNQLHMQLAPVTRGSGANHKEYVCEQGNRILNGIFYFLAVQQVQVSKGSKIPRNPVF